MSGQILRGVNGTATEVILPTPRPTPDQEATLAYWFLDCPGQAVAWNNYGLAVIHLRPIEGVRPAIVRVPGATHEVMLVALNPEKNPTLNDPASWQILTPINLMEQVQLPDDESAVDLLRDAAQAVVDGILWAEPPLAGQVEPWRTVLIKTAAHIRGEEHAP